MLLARILSPILAKPEVEALISGLDIPDELLRAEQANRAVLAGALGLLLFDDLYRRVPDAAAYWNEQCEQGRKLMLDHGALRTVTAASGALPPGRLAFSRLLEPLGYSEAAIYPLDRIGMTGYVYRHDDFPEDLPQYFVSELYPERFSPEFQAATARVTASSRDPLDADSVSLLRKLTEGQPLGEDEAGRLLRVLTGCFARQHDLPSVEDYTLLLDESAEMAWISTEGNVFNHATDRVADLEAVADAQRRKGRDVKNRIEISATGRVRQTALRAAPVEREFRAKDGTLIRRTVPGSFFEFISRDNFIDPETRTPRLDLAFDTGNAQGIFKMTATNTK
jgi:hypothetical protein